MVPTKSKKIAKSLKVTITIYKANRCCESQECGSDFPKSSLEECGLGREMSISETSSARVQNEDLFTKFDIYISENFAFFLMLRIYIPVVHTDKEICHSQ
jgi:hypothetical protein